MKSIFITMPALALLALAVSPSFAQNGNKKGWLEGTIMTSDGKMPSSYRGFFGAPMVRGYQNGQAIFRARVQADEGFFDVRNLEAGIYEIRVPFGWTGQKFDKPCRPQRIFGVVIKPGVRTKLAITVSSGTKPEEVGKPNVATTEAIVLSKQLKCLQTKLDGLTTQVRKLQAEVKRLNSQDK